LRSREEYSWLVTEKDGHFVQGTGTDYIYGFITVSHFYGGDYEIGLDYKLYIVRTD